MEAAELIWNSWVNGKKIETLPDSIVPYSRNEAYKIQEQIEVLSKNTSFRSFVDSLLQKEKKRNGVNFFGK